MASWTHLPKGLTVHSYARFSDPSQAAGTSTDRQKEGLTKFVATGDHTLSGLQMSDKGKSAHKGNKQKALNEFLRILRLRDGRIKADDVLFVEALDRISRKGIRATQDVVNEILNAGIHIAIAIPMEKVYLASADNELGDAVELAAFAFAAHSYSANLSQRVAKFYIIARKNAYDKKTKINSGPPPAWFTVIRGDEERLGFEWKPSAKETIQYIFTRTIDGIGGKKLCKELNQKFPCFGRSGKWNERYMRSILNGRHVLGELQPMKLDEMGKRVVAGDVIENYYPAAVTEDEWRDANAAAGNRKRERGPTTKYVNLFTGIVWHAIDDCPVHIYTYQQRRADGRRVIFRRLKSHDAEAGVPGASTETIGVEDFEYVVLRFLNELDLSIFDGNNAQAAELQSLIHLRTKKMKRIEEIEADEEGAVAVLRKQLAKLNAECEELDKRIDALKVATDNSTGSSVEKLRRLATLEMNPENRQKLREAIKRVVKRITIMPAKLGPQRKSPVGSMVEVELHNGLRRRFIQLGRKYSISYESKDGGVNTTPKKVKKALEWLATRTDADGLGLHHLFGVIV